MYGAWPTYLCSQYALQLIFFWKSQSLANQHAFIQNGLQAVSKHAIIQLGWAGIKAANQWNQYYHCHAVFQLPKPTNSFALALGDQQQKLIVSMRVKISANTINAHFQEQIETVIKSNRTSNRNGHQIEMVIRS